MTMFAVICCLVLGHMCAQANCATLSELTDLVTEYEVERFVGVLDQYDDLGHKKSHNPCECKGDGCSCSVKHSFKVFGHRYHLSLSLKLEFLEDNKFRIEFKSGSHTLFKKTFPLSKKVKECEHIPGIPSKVAKVCLELNKIDIKKRHFCAKIELKAIGFHKSFGFGCHTIPVKEEDRMMGLNSDAFLLDEPELVDMETELESGDLD